MSTPNELTGTDGIDPQDIVMVWSRRNRDTRGVSFGELNDSVRAVAVEAVASETDGAVAAVQAAGAAALAPLADSVSQASQSATAASGARADAIQARDAAAASAAAASDALAGAAKKVDLAADGGSSLVGWLRAGIGAVSATLSRWLGWQNAHVFEFMSLAQIADVLSGAPVLDHTAAVQKCITASNGKGMTFGDAGVFLISAPLSFVGYSGDVHCGVTLKAKSATAIPRMVDLTGASRVKWTGRTVLDASQTSATVPGDARAEIGIYVRDARDIEIDNVKHVNARVFRPVFVSGSSAVAGSVTDSMGSKRIFLSRLSGVAIPYSSPDEGVYNVVSSDFYTGTNGGACFAASNGVKVADYTVDTSVALARTTEEIYFKDCDLVGHDRIALLNCRAVHGTDVRHWLGNTRGIDCSPTVEDVTWTGGHLSGGAASIVGNYCCKNLNFSNLSVAANSPTGQQRTFTFGVGTTDVNVSNITGSGGAQRHLVIEGAKRVTFANVKLRNYLGAATTLALSVNGGLAANASNYVTEGITLDGCDLQANYGLVFGENAGTATVALGGVTIQGTFFDKVSELFNTGLAAMPTNGQIRWINSTAKKSGNAQDLLPASFMFYMGGNLNLQMWDTYTCGGATTYPIFVTMRYYAPEKDGGGGDATRNPGVLAYVKKSGSTFFTPLLYGIDWFVDGTYAATMVDRIRMYTPANLANGDVVAVQRIR